MRTFFSMSDAWDRHEADVRRRGGPERAGDKPEMEVQDIVQEGVKPRRRLKVKEGYTTGLTNADVNYKGDRVVIVGEDSDRDRGTVEQYVQRYGDDGQSRGTYRVTWERTGPGELTIARTEKVRGV